MLSTVADLLAVPADRHGDNPAVLDGGHVVTYRQLLDQARSCAASLAQSAELGDRIALLLPRSAQTLAVFFGAQLAGLVPVFVHEQLRPRQVAHIVGHAQAALAVTTTRLRPLLRDCPLPEAQILGADHLIARGPALGRRRIGRDLAMLTYTSGSTGTPKGIMVSHANLIAGALIVADYLHLSAADRTLALLPWSFDYGLNQVLATFAAGGTIVVQRSAFPPDICRALTTADVTGLAGVPTLWAALTGPHSPFTRHRYPHLRYVTNSGGHLPAPVIQALRAAHPRTGVYAMYGLTEAFRSTYLTPERTDTKPASVGRPVPDSDVLILDDSGHRCPPGVIGQIVHRGPTVALGYWRDPDATATVFRPHPFAPAGAAGETVVYSGDYGHLDDDGDLHLAGRRDELLKVRGVRVTLGEIEAEIMASGLTAAAVATAADNGETDPVLLAAIQPRDHTFQLARLQEYCRDELPAYMRPAHLHVMDPLPCTPHGKPDRAAIARHLERAFAAQTGQP
jgi:acyl-CoA synthetase (AMP-forming)/AMP-acid ligase II